MLYCIVGFYLFIDRLWMGLHDGRIDPLVYKTLDGLVGAQDILKKQYNGAYKGMIRDTVSKFKLGGKIGLVTEMNKLSEEDWAHWSKLLEADETMITKSPQELKKASHVCVVKQGDMFIGGIGIWEMPYSSIVSQANTIYQRGSLVVHPDYRGVELGRYLIDRINTSYSNYPLYGITLVQSVKNSNQESDMSVHTVIDLKEQYPEFVERLEIQRKKNFDYIGGDGHDNHVVILNKKLEIILQQDCNYKNQNRENVTPIHDALLGLYENDIHQGDVVSAVSN